MGTSLYMWLQAMRTHPDIGLLITSLLQDVNKLVAICVNCTYWLLLHKVISLHSPLLNLKGVINFPQKDKEGDEIFRVNKGSQKRGGSIYNRRRGAKKLSMLMFDFFWGGGQKFNKNTV